jgi:hypothetical protein
MSDIFLRRDVNGITPMDMKYMNDNFKYIWLKVFGNITTGDMRDGAVTGEKIAKNTVTADNIDTSTLIVGENIAMGENASIVWAQVSDRPTIPSTPGEVGAVADDMAAVFNALTDNGLARGLYMSGGQLYINADYIQSGLVVAARIKTSELIVGDNIAMGSNATIAWTKVTSKPTDLVYDSDLTNYVTNGDLSDALYDYIDNNQLTTILGYDYIVTGKIAANQIAAGNISGVTIQTADYDDYIVLEEQYLQIFHNDTPYCRFAYDNDYDGSYRSYAQLYNCYLVGYSSHLEASIYGTTALDIDESGISTNGVTCTSISASNNVHINGALTVDGVKQATVYTKDFGKVTLSCDESPESVFIDRGTGTIQEDGLSAIELEQIFRQTVYTEDANYYVFLQGLNCDVKLVERQKDKFIVSGKKYDKFLWRVEAYRLGYEHKRFNELYDWTEFDKNESIIKERRKDKNRGEKVEPKDI